MVQFTTLISTFALAIAAVQAAPGSKLRARQGLPDPSGDKNIGNGAGTQFIGGQCLGTADCASGCCASFPSGGQIIGVCSGPAVGDQNGKQGCGFESSGAAGNGGNNNGGNNNGGNNNGGNNNGGNNNGGNNNAGNNNAGNNNAGNNNAGNNNAGNNNAGNNNAGNNNAANGVPTEITVIPTQLKPDPVNGLANVGTGNGQQFITGACESDADCASGCCSTINNGVDQPFGICSGPGASRQNGKQCCGFPNGPLNCPANP